ncbi:MAG: outer membrane beta-barrel protein [Desulfobulbaceae bacterium]|nr:outer membrane beta-barrel protein [Desulfobulbaceae bacterium]
MKKVLSAVAVSAFVFTASYCFAGGQGTTTDGCPDDCQKQLDSLQSSQSRQDEQMKAQTGQINNQAGIIEKQAEEINALQQAEVHPWYVKGVAKLTMFSNLGTDTIDDAYSIGFDTDDTGYGWGLALGRQFGQFRVEGQYDTNKADLDDARLTYLDSGTNVAVGSGDIRVSTVMINGYYDFPVAEGWSLYVMAGMGYGNVTLSVYNIDDDETTFAYKGGAGVTYSFAGNQAVDLGYEYMGTGDVVIEGLDVNDIESNNIILAYRYSF